MSKSMLLSFLSVVLLPNVACLLLERQVGSDYGTCDDAWEIFWTSSKHSDEEQGAVDYIKTTCDPESACNYEAPAPTPCDGSTCDLWADPHVSGFDNTELQGPDYLFLASHIDKLNSSGVAEDRVNVSHRLTHNITFRNKLRTFDQRPVDVNALDAGDFWLVKNPAVFIQGRFRLAQEFLPDNAAIGAVAVGGPFLDGDRIVIEPLDGQLLLNTFAMPSGNISMQTTSGNISMLHYKEKKEKKHHEKKHHKHTDSQVQEEEEHADVSLELPKGISMVIRRWKRHLDVKIRMPKLEGGVDGECGNMNGIPDDDTENLIAKRMGSLRIDEEHKLFQKSFTVNVRLDADGLIAVQNSKHPRAVRDFIHAVLADSGAQVLSESELSGLVPYYDGQIDQKSYSELLSELETASWVQGFERPTGKTIFQIAMDGLSDLFR